MFLQIQIVIIAIFISGVILILCLRRKELLRMISSIIPHTELGRSLIALFNGVGILCTAFVLGIFGKTQPLIVALTLEVCGLLFALLALTFYPVSLKVATIIDKEAKIILDDLFNRTVKVLGESGNKEDTTEQVKTILEGKVIPNLVERGTGIEKMFVYSFVLFYYYAYIFTLLGIISLLIGVGINI